MHLWVHIVISFWCYVSDFFLQSCSSQGYKFLSRSSCSPSVVFDGLCSHDLLLFLVYLSVASFLKCSESRILKHDDDFVAAAALADEAWIMQITT